MNARASATAISDQEDAHTPPTPFDVELEQALLGAILVDDANIVAISDSLRPEQFFDPLHQRLFTQMLGCKRVGLTVSPLTVYAALKNDPGLIEVGGLAYLAGMSAASPALPNVKDYARIIAEYSARRELIRSCQSLIDRVAAHSSEPLADALEEAERALARIQTPADGAAPLNLIDLTGREIPPREELVEGLIPMRAVTLLAGDGGTGKSQISAQLAVSTRLGRKWLGQVVRTDGRVFYISAEDDLDELHRRFAAIAATEEVTFEDLNGLHILSLAGEDAVLATAISGEVLEPTALYRALRQRVHEIRPALVVFDTLSDFYGADENKRHLARQFVGLLRKIAIDFDCAVLLLSHPSLEGMRSGTGTSGNTGWSNSVRSRLYFERIKSGGDTEDDPDARVLRVKKANYGPTGLEIRVRWDRGVFKLHTEGTSFTALAAEAKADRVFIDLLTTYEAEGRKVVATPGHSYAPAVFATDKRSGGVTKRAFVDAMNRAFNSGQIRNEEFGPPSKRRQRLVIARGSE